MGVLRSDLVILVTSETWYTKPYKLGGSKAITLPLLLIKDHTHSWRVVGVRRAIMLQARYQQPMSINVESPKTPCGGWNMAAQFCCFCCCLVVCFLMLFVCFFLIWRLRLVLSSTLPRQTARYALLWSCNPGTMPTRTSVFSRCKHWVMGTIEKPSFFCLSELCGMNKLWFALSAIWSRLNWNVTLCFRVHQGSS